MNRQEKQLIIDSVKGEFKDSQSTFVVGVKGLTVGAIQGLRSDLRTKGASLKVTKNTLLKIAVEKISGINELSPFFKDQVAIVFTKDDAPGVAKVLFDSSKKMENLVLVAGSLNDKVIDKSTILFLASLPSQDVLRAQVCGALNAPISNFASIMRLFIIRLALVLKRISEKK